MSKAGLSDSKKAKVGFVGFCGCDGAGVLMNFIILSSSFCRLAADVFLIFCGDGLVLMVGVEMDSLLSLIHI